MSLGKFVLGAERWGGGGRGGLPYHAKDMVPLEHCETWTVAPVVCRSELRGHGGRER